MNKKLFITTVILVFGILLGSYSSAASGAFDVSIDRVKVNGNVISESRQNLIVDANVFSVQVDFTAVETLVKGHVEAILRGRQSGDVVSDSTITFDLVKNQSSTVNLTLVLIDSLKRETDFDLTIKIVDVNGNSEQKTYGIKTEPTRVRGALDVSIDRVRVNGKIVATSRTNFIEESDDFDVLVEFTALEDLDDAHVEAVLKDLRTGSVVADASPNFDLSDSSNSSRLLRLELLNELKKSNSFELTIKIIDSEGDFVQQLYGLKMKNGVISTGRALDISIDSVEVENEIIAENENNFLIIGGNEKELDLKIALTSLENVEDAHIEAVLTLENGDVIADATATFDINDGGSIVKKLELPLIGKFEHNNFKLKVRIIDAEGDSIEKLYGLKISRKDFPFIITSILLEPENNVKAGKSLVVKLSFIDNGFVPVEGLNAIVSIPELGSSSTKFLSKRNNDAEIEEEFILKIFDSVPTGSYTLRAEIVSQFGKESEIKEIPVFIIGINDQVVQLVNDKLIIDVPIIKQNLYEDSEVLHPITLTNKGPDANTYTLLLDGANWAKLRLSESNVFVLKPKESKIINIYASSKGNVKGEQTFLVTIKVNDEILKQVPLKGNVVVDKRTFVLNLKNALKIILIVLVALLVLAGLFFGIRRYMEKEAKEISEEIPNQTDGEAYY